MRPPTDALPAIGDHASTATRLRSADAALARRVPALGGLAAVLDVDTLLERLDILLPGGVSRPVSGRVDYARYKPGTSIVVAVTFETTQGPVPAYAKAVRSSGRPKLTKARLKADAGAVWPVVVDPALGVAIGTAAGDRRLPGAAALAHERGAAVLRYKPERRLVTRGVHDGQPALRKAHQPAAARTAAAAHRAVGAMSAPVPELLHVDAKRGIVACSWINGTPLHALAGDADAQAQAGAALARLHRGAPTAGLPPAAPIRRELTAAANAIGALVPALAPRAAALARRLADRLDARSDPPVPIHGDWSADQALLTPHGIVLVDLDRARHDYPATDIATWIAAAHVAGDASAEAEPEEIAGALLDGHVAAGGPPLHGRLAAPTAAALLQRAVEPFRMRQADWPDAIERLLITSEHQIRATRW